jgi:NAD-dependent dihydropyrimidine dehydrogenase PreA subunit
MPGMNGTGPEGSGPMSGRAMGPCAGNAQAGRDGAWKGSGAGRALVEIRRGFGAGCAVPWYGVGYDAATAPRTPPQATRRASERARPRLKPNSPPPSGSCPPRRERAPRTRTAGVRSGRRTVIAVASGKGGTGKTTWPPTSPWRPPSGPHGPGRPGRGSPRRFRLLPRGSVRGEERVRDRPSSLLQAGGLRRCGACMRACRFASIVAIGRTVAINETTCKGCGACVHACPRGARGRRTSPQGIPAWERRRRPHP